MAIGRLSPTAPLPDSSTKNQKRGTETSAALAPGKRKSFTRHTVASVVREKKERGSGTIRGGVWAAVSKSSKDTQTTGRNPAPLLDILSKISTLPQEKWALQGETLLHHRCWRSFGLGRERWGEENEMDERSPGWMGFCRCSILLAVPSNLPLRSRNPWIQFTDNEDLLCRLYSKGRVLGHKRAKRNSRPNTSLLQIEGVGSKEEAQFYLGKVRRSTTFLAHRSSFLPCY